MSFSNFDTNLGLSKPSHSKQKSVTHLFLKLCSQQPQTDGMIDEQTDSDSDFTFLLCDRGQKQAKIN